MDYETKPISREVIREFAKKFRKKFGAEQTGAFPVLQALDKLHEIYPKCDYVILPDKSLPTKTMADCVENDEGGFTIEIKESVYLGAYEDNKGSFRGFICHELSHVFLFMNGYKPIYSRKFERGNMPAYRSVEWQAMALAAEIMIPYEESVGMRKQEIIDKYQVSIAFAEKRRKLDRKDNKIKILFDF